MGIQITKNPPEKIQIAKLVVELLKIQRKKMDMQIIHLKSTMR